MIGRRRVNAAQLFAAFLVVFFLLEPPAPVRATDENAGTFGGAFLGVPPGATLMSVPDVVAGMQPDASMLFSNPATLAELSRGQVFLSRASWLEDLSMNAASLAFPIRPYNTTLSFGSRLLHSGGLRGYDSANPTQAVAEESYYGLSFSTALSKRFERLGLDLGLGVTYLREHLPMETGNGLAMSFGASYNRAGHHVELFAQDVGGEISFEGRDYPIDGRYVAGYGYAFYQGRGRLDVGTQLVMCRSQVKRLQFGAAYHFHRFFTLRAGLDREFDAPDNTQMPLSAGLGFRHGNLSVYYAYASQEYFSNTHTFSVAFSFGSSTILDKNGAAPIGKTTPTAAETPVERSASAQPPTTDGPSEAPEPMSYAIIAGVHSRPGSARAEMRALRLLKVPAVIENTGDRFKVLIGRYDSLEKANMELARLEQKGHRFRIDVEGP